MNPTPNTCIKFTILALVLLFIYSCFSFATGDALQVEIESNIESVGGFLGDRNRLSIYVTFPSDWEMNKPKFSGWGENFHVVGMKSSKPEVCSESKKCQRIEIDFAVFATGDVDLPSVKIEFNKKNKTKAEFLLGPWPLRIKSLLSDDDKDIRDIKGPLSITEKGLSLISIVLGLLLLSGVIAAVFLLRRKRTKDLRIEQRELEPAHIEAYRALEKLSGLNLLVQGEFKNYYVRLVEVAKRYISRRFDFDAEDKTSREIKKKSQSIEISREARHILGDFLDQADIVKFAKHVPTGSQAREAMESVYYFVDMTREEMVIVTAQSPVEEKHPALGDGTVAG